MRWFCCTFYCVFPPPSFFCFEPPFLETLALSPQVVSIAFLSHAIVLIRNPFPLGSFLGRGVVLGILLLSFLLRRLVLLKRRGCAPPRSPVFSFLEFFRVSTQVMNSIQYNPSGISDWFFLLPFSRPLLSVTDVFCRDLDFKTGDVCLRLLFVIPRRSIFSFYSRDKSPLVRLPMIYIRSHDRGTRRG